MGRISRAWVGLLETLISALPAGARDALARGVGTLAYLLGIRRRVTLDNLAHAFPERTERERRQIARGAYVNMARVVFEAFASNQLDEAAMARTVDYENWEALTGSLGAGQGALLATAHFGSWELLGEVLARRGYPITAVVRPLKGALNAVLMERRVEAGIKLIAPRGAVPESVKALHRGDLVATLVDQALPTRKGVMVPFFGRPAATSPGFAWAALRSGAPVFVVMGAREGRRLRFIIQGPLPVTRTGDLKRDVERLTAEVTAQIEAIIRRYPDQWLWLHRRWKPPRA